MESSEARYLQVGDAVPTVRLDNETGQFASTNATVLEIHPCPGDKQEAKRLVGELMNKYQGRGQTGVTVIRSISAAWSASQK